jgi:cell wall-associated NlpC family hydrolase
MTDWRARVIAEARTWIGTPWHHQARVKGAGVDCVMLLCEVYEAAGVIPHVVPENYPIDIMLHRASQPVVRWLMMFADEVSEPKEADVVVYHFGRSFSHAAIYIGGARVIHAFRHAGQVLETGMDDANLAGREKRYFSMRGVA